MSRMTRSFSLLILAIVCFANVLFCFAQEINPKSFVERYQAAKLFHLRGPISKSMSWLCWQITI